MKTRQAEIYIRADVVCRRVFTRCYLQSAVMLRDDWRTAALRCCLQQASQAAALVMRQNVTRRIRARVVDVHHTIRGCASDAEKESVSAR